MLLHFTHQTASTQSVQSLLYWSLGRHYGENVYRCFLAHYLHLSFKQYIWCLLLFYNCAHTVRELWQLLSCTILNIIIWVIVQLVNLVSIILLPSRKLSVYSPPFSFLLFYVPWIYQVLLVIKWIAPVSILWCCSNVIILNDQLHKYL